MKRFDAKFLEIEGIYTSEEIPIPLLELIGQLTSVLIVGFIVTDLLKADPHKLWKLTF